MHPQLMRGVVGRRQAVRVGRVNSNVQAGTGIY